MHTCYEDVRNALDEVPCVNAHVHQGGHESEQFPAERSVMAFVTECLPGYLERDYAPLWQGVSDREGWAAISRNGPASHQWGLCFESGCPDSCAIVSV